MADILIPEGSKFKGTIQMGKANLDYNITLFDISLSNFSFEHTVSYGGNAIDTKSGAGSLNIVDSNLAILNYSDPETAFNGEINLASTDMDIKGLWNQLNGSALKGDFMLKKIA